MIFRLFGEISLFIIYKSEELYYTKYSNLPNRRRIGKIVKWKRLR